MRKHGDYEDHNNPTAADVNEDWWKHTQAAISRSSERKLLQQCCFDSESHMPFNTILFSSYSYSSVALLNELQLLILWKILAA